MSAPENQPAPETSVRLCWWLGIYFSALVPLVIRAFANEFNMLVPIFFPVPLGFIFIPLISHLPHALAQVAFPPLFFVGFAFYAWHLRATLKATSRRRFNYLLLVLVIVVLANQFIMVTMATSIRE